MPQKDKDARKEYNKSQYLKRKSSQTGVKDIKINTNTIIEPCEDLNYYLLKFYKIIQKVNDEFLNVKLTPYQPIDQTIDQPKDQVDYRQLFANVVCELNTDYNTIENASKIFDRQVIFNNGKQLPIRKYYFNVYDNGWRINGRFYDFDTIFGRFLFNCDEQKLVKKDTYKPLYDVCCWKKCRCGIEVIGMKPKRTKDGKYTYRGLIINELKNACKINGIKGYGKMDKCELVKALLKC
jgi:hypothetical protein